MRSAADPSLPLTLPETSPDDSLEQSSVIMIFVRSTCPACPSAIRAAQGLGIHIEIVNTDTVEGMAEAVRRKVMSVPTAILLSAEGKEIKRVFNAEEISKLPYNLTDKSLSANKATRSILAAIPLNV